MKIPSYKRWLPLGLGLAFVVFISAAHFSAVDPGSRPFTDQQLKEMTDLSQTLEKLKNLSDEQIAAHQNPQKVETRGVLFGFQRFLELSGFRQNWRIAASPAPEIQGFEIRAYHKTIKPMTGVYRTVFAICSELDNEGECAPGLRSRLEFEMLKGIERVQSPQLIEAFSRYVVFRAEKAFDEEYRKVEFIAFRHAIKTTRDYSKRANTQILLTKDL